MSSDAMEKAHIMTAHRGKSHNELGRKIIIIAKIIQDYIIVLKIQQAGKKS